MSEFGSGIVVCLAKFSEHLHEHGPYSERAIREFDRADEGEYERLHEEARRHPQGDAAQKLLRLGVMGTSGSKEAALSRAIAIWMNGASDHFYGLDESAPEPLRELADLTLRIGHGFTDEVWTIAHVDLIRELWRRSCLAVDERLGVKADWGEW